MTYIDLENRNFLKEKEHAEREVHKAQEALDSATELYERDVRTEQHVTRSLAERRAEYAKLRDELNTYLGFKERIDSGSESRASEYEDLAEFHREQATLHSPEQSDRIERDLLLARVASEMIPIYHFVSSLIQQKLEEVGGAIRECELVMPDLKRLATTTKKSLRNTQQHQRGCQNRLARAQKNLERALQQCAAQDRKNQKTQAQRDRKIARNMRIPEEYIDRGEVEIHRKADGSIHAYIGTGEDHGHFVGYNNGTVVTMRRLPGEARGPQNQIRLSAAEVLPRT